MEMQEWEVLEQLTGQVDPEMFARVWRRVMPEGRESPIEVDLPPRPEREKNCVSGASFEESGQIMLRLYALAGECRWGYRELGRRGVGRQASIMEEQCRRAQRRLEALLYACTGRGIPEHRPGTAWGGSARELLRVQYGREMEWERLCRRLSRYSQSADAGGLAGELAREGLRRAAAVREMLERL